MKHAVITTTIYPTTGLEKWAATGLRPGDLLCVAGDNKTPHRAVIDELDSLRTRYQLETHYSASSTAWKIDSVVGWNTVQRRNVAILDAIALGADVITTVDTDNEPLTNDHLEKVRAYFTDPWRYNIISTKSGWFNAASLLGHYPEIVHRGYPMTQRPRIVSPMPTVKTVDDGYPVGVHTSLWIGDPDIDAIERLVNGPIVDEEKVFPQGWGLRPGTWCPFNSQATTFGPGVLPLLNVWPGVGRYDDIWPSYVARHILDYHKMITVYGTPNVRQSRHEHDLLRDLHNEMYGYQHTPAFCEAVRSIELHDASNGDEPLHEKILNQLDTAYQVLRNLPFIYGQTRDFMSAWLEDVKTAYAFRGDSK